jgi:hypothetical protein
MLKDGYRAIVVHFLKNHIIAKDYFLNFFRYSTGDMPMTFLKSLEK